MEREYWYEIEGKVYPDEEHQVAKLLDVGQILFPMFK